MRFKGVDILLLCILCVVVFHTSRVYSMGQSGDVSCETKGAPTYEKNVYPVPSRVTRRISEVGYEEDAETSKYGFDVPLPDANRGCFAVEDYGAAADGVTDCTAAFYGALAAAKGSGTPAEICFRGKGHYLFRPDTKYGSDDAAILNVRKVRNLVIRGQGTETVLVMAAPALGGLKISESDIVQLRDFAVDYNPLPYTQGTVSEVNAAEGWIALRLHAGYPDPGTLLSLIPTSHGGYRMEEAKGGSFRWPPILGLSINGVERIDDARWRIRMSSSQLQNYLKPGDEFIQVGRRHGQHAIVASRTRHFYVKDVAVHASPAVGLLLSSVDGANIDGYSDCAPAGSSRLLSTDADGLFVHGLRGGITIRNCYFMGQGDDCINLHSPAFGNHSVTQVSDTELVLKGDTDIRAGDTLEFMDPTVGLCKGQTGITSVVKEEEGLRVLLEKTLSSIDYRRDTDMLYPASLSASNFKIVHNYFGQNRSRCLLIQARNGLIEANTGENAEGYGVLMTYGGTAWPEGIIPENVTIRRNVFRNVTNVGMAGTIEACDGSRFRNFRNITIEDNRFINTRKMAGLLMGVEGAKILRNSVESDLGGRNTTNDARWYPVDCSVFLSNCGGVKIDKLNVVDPEIKEAVVYIDASCDPGSERVDIGAICAKTADGIPAVLDRRKPKHE